MKTKDFQTIQTGFVPHPPAKENKGKGKERTKTANGVIEKENEEIQTIKATDPTIMDQHIHKIPINQKEKGILKDPKEKTKEKGSHDTATERVNKTMRQNH